ncbi:SGNH/GDSL hydrolase family protein [Daejeonella lutea]|uniref:N-terminus of Esterase_SGNH_hydro-type n=1 Tax=Daejeonella lutea TaxID=572036 RepID=A0A1T5EPR2_9SPHI|nr:SGNH/GDSL hydrolase family protein [Daejeonella lutea]SKB85905.1 N-terminus of Esterase_SGNH_hydro-type [Daejeonella lutea]
MKRCFYIFLLCCSYSLSIAQEAPAKKDNSKYYGKESFLIEGTGIPESEKESPYDRLPLASKGKVRQAVWDLSKNSAGLTARFITNSPSIKVKWGVLNDTKLNHMASTGIKGVDLYCKVNGKWVYVNTGRPTAIENEATLLTSLAPGEHEFKIYLPLYDGTTHLEVGIDSTSYIKKPNPETLLPIVFYGTSILQGGCASRPGMAFTNIISRKMNVDCYNFGFSGNGRMDPPVVDVISKIKASFYVIDCLPNMTPKQVTDSVMPLAKALRAKNPSTPIVFVENIEYARIPFEASIKKSFEDKNNALKVEFAKLQKEGMKGLYYISSANAIGDDNEGTVDGTHMTDLGFMRYADYLIGKFKDNKLVVR